MPEQVQSQLIPIEANTSAIEITKSIALERVLGRNDVDLVGDEEFLSYVWTVFDWIFATVASLNDMNRKVGKEIKALKKSELDQAKKQELFEAKLKEYTLRKAITKFSHQVSQFK